MRIIDADKFLEDMKSTDRYFMVKFDIERAPTVDLWHYPSKGELPEKDTKCLVHTIADNYYVALIDSSDKCWCTGEMFEKILRPGDIDRWQYIVPPREGV